jgi:hypothetical protein
MSRRDRRSGLGAMKKRVSLDRLRDISKQRSIRTPQALRLDRRAPSEEGEVQMAAIEWPVPGSNDF